MTNTSLNQKEVCVKRVYQLMVKINISIDLTKINIIS